MPYIKVLGEYFPVNRISGGDMDENEFEIQNGRYIQFLDKTKCLEFKPKINDQVCILVEVSTEELYRLGEITKEIVDLNIYHEPIYRRQEIRKLAEEADKITNKPVTIVTEEKFFNMLEAGEAVDFIAS